MTSDTQTPHERAIEAGCATAVSYAAKGTGVAAAAVGAITAYLDTMRNDPVQPMTMQPVAPASDVNAELLRALKQAATWTREYEATWAEEAKRHNLPTDAALHAACVSGLFKTQATYLETAIAKATKRQADEWEASRGTAPNATGELSSEAFIRKERDGWEHIAKEAGDAKEPAPVKALRDVDRLSHADDYCKRQTGPKLERAAARLRIKNPKAAKIIKRILHEHKFKKLRCNNCGSTSDDCLAQYISEAWAQDYAPCGAYGGEKG